MFFIGRDRFNRADKQDVIEMIRLYKRRVGKVGFHFHFGRMKVARYWWATGGFSRGNNVTPLVDGEAYFKALYDACDGAKKYIFVTAWLMDVTIQLKRPGTANAPRLDNKYSLLQVIERASARGVQVRIVLWERIISPRTQLQRNLLLMAGSNVKVLLYDETNYLSSLHQKTAVIDGKVAFCGGIDPTKKGGDHWDTSDHIAQDQRRDVKESRNWHDVQVMIEGPAVKYIQENFVRRWNVGSWQDLDVSLIWDANPKGKLNVQVIRTIPWQEWMKDFRPADTADYSCVEVYSRAIINAQHFIYIENQYFNCDFLVDLLEERLKANRNLYLIALLPKEIEFPMNEAAGGVVDGISPQEAVDKLMKAAPGRVMFLSPVHEDMSAIYVHAKIMIVDDVFAVIGSANFSNRSMFDNDEELGIAWMDQSGATVSAFRKRLWSEHLEVKPSSEELSKGSSAELFQAWYRLDLNRPIGSKRFVMAFRKWTGN